MILHGGYVSLHTEIENAGVNRPHLVVLQGPGLGDFFEITDDELVLGSDPFSADIVVRDVEVEPRHAELYRRPGGYALRGVEAGKTIALNGEILEKPGCGQPLSDGDRIHVGDSVLEYSHQDEIKASFFEQLHELVNRDHLTGLYSKGRLLGDFVVGDIGHISGVMHEGEGRTAPRFGGDEYQGVLPDLSKQEALQVAEEIRRSVEAHTFERDDVSATTTISIGVASYPEDGTTHQELTHAADAALYRAKRAGGNIVSE